MHKSRPGVTPCGFIRDCRFPSSAAIIITGELRKGSAVDHALNTPYCVERGLCPHYVRPRPRFFVMI
jgi:hypothetical protein